MLLILSSSDAVSSSQSRYSADWVSFYVSSYNPMVLSEVSQYVAHEEPRVLTTDKKQFSLHLLSLCQGFCSAQLLPHCSSVP